MFDYRAIQRRENHDSGIQLHNMSSKEEGLGEKAWARRIYNKHFIEYFFSKASNIEKLDD